MGSFEERSGGEAFAADALIVHEVVEEHVVVAGLTPIDDSTWAIYGSIPVDGEVIVAEFETQAEAEYVLEQIVEEGQIVEEQEKEQ